MKFILLAVAIVALAHGGIEEDAVEKVKTLEKRLSEIKEELKLKAESFIDEKQSDFNAMFQDRLKELREMASKMGENMQPLMEEIHKSIIPKERAKPKGN